MIVYPRLAPRPAAAKLSAAKTNMKILSLLLALFVGVSFNAVAASDSGKKTKGKLHHVVAFKFKPTATKEQIKQVVDAFKDLKKKIKEVHTLKWGTNVSPEKHDKGFTHVFLLTFQTEQDRDAYLVHPDHKAFGEKLKPILDDVLAIDFWSEK